MIQIRVDPEFRALVPPLGADEHAGLEKSIEAEGCRDALMVWAENGILLDGHNRHEICQRLSIPFKTIEQSFPSRDAAKIWIIRNQFARRNLTTYQRAELALVLEPLLAAKAKEKQRASGGAVPQKSAEPAVETRRELAKIAGVSHDTIMKVRVIAEMAPETVRAKLRDPNAGTSINREYRALTIRTQREERHAAIVQRAIVAPAATFSVIYADPPWRYSDVRGGMGGSCDQYPTLATDDVCRYLVDIDLKVSDDAILFLWATVPLLPDALRVMSAWGFEYTTAYCWDKQIAALGHYHRCRFELLLVGIRGAMPPPIDASHDDVISVKRTSHSAKPEEFRAIIECGYGQHRKVELFARGDAPGWISLGYEAGDDIAVEWDPDEIPDEAPLDAEDNGAALEAA